jgi:phosphopentomutase
MPRAFILLLDSFGLGATPDAARFGDVTPERSANTFGHIAAWCQQQGTPLALPNLEQLGIAACAHTACGAWPAGFSQRNGFTGAYGACAERSTGKDTPSGHWEIAGVPVEFDWGYFANNEPVFPPELIAALIEQAQLPGVLGLCHASGTEIINRLGDAHCASGQPIIYTSADSVLQIAAHEETFGLERLLALCQTAFELVKPYRIGRVIARPFLGSQGQYKRTARRKDLAVPPPAPTLLDSVVQHGGQVLAVGKVGDIFAQQGISRVIKADGNMALFDAMLEQQQNAPDASLTFTNFVDFDQNFGHRRDIPGYAEALRQLDARLPEFTRHMRPGDLAVICADHGCDPSWPGSDHTREHIPVLFFGSTGNGKLVTEQALGISPTFADIGQTLAKHLHLPPLAHGRSLL